MKNTNITRTVNIAVASVTLFDLGTEQLENTVMKLYTTQKLTEKDFIKALENTQNVKVLKVSDITYTSELYEMDLETFVNNAHKVGNGRVTL